MGTGRIGGPIKVLTSPVLANWLFWGGGGGEKGAHWYERDFSEKVSKFVGPVSVAWSPRCCAIKRRTAAGSLRGTVGISLKMVERQQDGE
jgi:hypothetical protein